MKSTAAGRDAAVWRWVAGPLASAPGIFGVRGTPGSPARLSREELGKRGSVNIE
ncbi:MAG: hypothetical protein WAL35_05815 [Acidimicrobiales bacterium]